MVIVRKKRWNQGDNNGKIERETLHREIWANKKNTRDRDIELEHDKVNYTQHKREKASEGGKHLQICICKHLKLPVILTVIYIDPHLPFIY